MSVIITTYSFCMSDCTMTNNLKNLLGPTHRRVAGSEPRNDISQKIIVNTQLTLLQSCDLLTNLRPKLSSPNISHPVTGEDNELSSAQHCRYRFLVTCNKCGRIHSTGFSVLLQEGPDRRQSLAELYDGNPPESLASLATTRVTCPFTGKQFSQKNYCHIFLIPVRRLESEPG